MKGRGMLACRPLLCMLMAAAVTGGARPASAQPYPTQTITFQVAFAAGGIADVVARLVGQKLSERLGIPWWWKIAAARAAISRQKRAALPRPTGIAFL